MNLTNTQKRIAILYQNLAALESVRHAKISRVLKGMEITLDDQSEEVVRNREIEVSRLYNEYYRPKRRNLITEIYKLEAVADYKQ